MEHVSNAHRFDFSEGERVRLADDDWSMVGHDAVLVQVEPVPGSTQCVVRVGEDYRTVSRAELRRAG